MVVFSFMAFICIIFVIVLLCSFGSSLNFVFSKAFVLVVIPKRAVSPGVVTCSCNILVDYPM